MAQQHLNLGTSPNDDTGDPIRTAAAKIEANFAELYSGKLDASLIDTDPTLAANSDAKLATQKAVKTYANSLIAANDAMVFKGVIDCSTNPNYPAADRGHTYRVSVAGKIGGVSGVNVEGGDILICTTDSVSAGDQATVGALWSVVQTNIDGAVTLTGAQTLTNKTLSAPSLTGAMSVQQLFSVGPAMTRTGNVAISAGGTSDIANGRGFIVLSENMSSGECVLVLLGDGSVTIVAQTGALFVVSTTPPSGKIGIAYNAGSATHRIFNNTGASIGLGGLFLRTG